MVGAAVVPTLPDLVAVTCPECDGETECDRCGSLRYVKVYGGCGEAPEVVGAFEVCACSPRPQSVERTCEICEQPGRLDNANVCTRCRDEMAAKIRQEADEYQAWVAEQLDFGRQAGWL